MLWLFATQFQSQHCEHNSTQKRIPHNVMYRCETRWMTDEDKVMLNTQKRQISRKVWASNRARSFENQKWPRAEGITYTIPHLVADFKRIRLEWLGPVFRMGQKRMAKNISESKPEGRRKPRRRWMRWLTDVGSYSQELKVKRWRQRANNRE